MMSPNQNINAFLKNLIFDIDAASSSSSSIGGEAVTPTSAFLKRSPSESSMSLIVYVQTYSLLHMNLVPWIKAKSSPPTTVFVPRVTSGTKYFYKFTRTAMNEIFFNDRVSEKSVSSILRL